MDNVLKPGDKILSLFTYFKVPENVDNIPDALRSLANYIECKPTFNVLNKSDIDESLNNLGYTLWPEFLNSLEAGFKRTGSVTLSKLTEDNQWEIIV